MSGVRRRSDPRADRESERTRASGNGAGPTGTNDPTISSPVPKVNDPAISGAVSKVNDPAIPGTVPKAMVTPCKV